MASLTVEKEKIPLGWQFILKTAVLEKAMNEACLSTAVHIEFKRSEDVILDARFYIPNERVDFPRFFIRVGMVETKYYISRRAIWEQDVPRALVGWMQVQMEVLEQGTITGKPHFVCRWDNEGLVISED
jgi:hypothetical protein